MSHKSFHLRWNNHLQNLRSLFETLYNQQDLVDVTLSCSDGILSAHKLVLTACSPYFESVFKANPCKHPIVILKGISLQEMQSLLEYMYVGSVDVEEDDLENLLQVANELQIKGLVQKALNIPTSSTKANAVVRQNKQNELKYTKNTPPPAEKELLWQAELIAKHADNSGNSQAESNLESNFIDCSNQSNKSLSDPIQIKQEEVYNDYEDNIEVEGDSYYQENVGNNSSAMETETEYTDESQATTAPAVNEEEEDPNNTFCTICNRSFQNRPSYRRHMQTHSGEKPHKCEYCSLSFLRLSHLQRHIRVHTGERPYACSQCSKQFSRSDKLKQHYVLHHSAVASPKINKPRGRPRKVQFPHGEITTPSTSLKW